MKRLAPMRRDTDGAKAWAAKPRKPLARSSMNQTAAKGLVRKPIKQRSRAQQDDSVRQASVRAEVFARDGRRCTMERYVGAVLTKFGGGQTRPVPPCGGRLEFAHRRKASAGGAYVAANGNACCTVHNQMHENEPSLTRALGGSRWVLVEGDSDWVRLGRKAQGVR